IEVSPARLSESDARVLESWQSTFEKIRWRYEIRVEEREKLSLRAFQSVYQRARFEIFATRTTHMRDVDPLRPPSLDRRAHDRGRFIGRIVEHLNFQKVHWIIQSRCCVDGALSDV